MEHCRICRSNEVNLVGIYTPYKDYHGFNVFDCMACGCRFVFGEDKIHEQMHTDPNSPYQSHIGYAEKINHLISAPTTRPLRSFLLKSRNYQFILNSIKPIEKESKIIELGCSLGYFAAGLRRLGYKNTIGGDISESAISKACSYFGNYFYTLTDDFFERHINTFHVVFHLGTIGCVNDPLEFTQRCLSILKPGGVLLFNSPNLNAVRAMNAIWNNRTPPPDLITLFDENFWIKKFSGENEVLINYEPYNHAINARKALDRLLKVNYLPDEHHKPYFLKTNRPPNILSKLIKKAALIPFEILSHTGLLNRYPDEFGMYVTIKKK